MNLFSNMFLDEKIEEAIGILFQASKTNAVLSFSGGADSVVLNALIKMYQIPINSIFFNKEVEGNHNRKIIKKVSKTYKNVIDANTESYAAIVNRLGFPIGNKNFSQMCYRLRTVPLSLNNINDKFRLITGVNLNKIARTDINMKFAIPLKFWYLAHNFPIQEKCCEILKKNPAKKVDRDMIVGIMKTDSDSRARTIKANFHGKHFPLQSWNKSDVFEFIKRFNIECSKAYQDRIVNENVTVVGATNTGCQECHFGQNMNHFLRIDGKKIKTSKFEIMKLEKPKAYKRMMSRVHEPTGITYREVIEVFDKSKNEEFLEESIQIRNRYITDILAIGKEILSEEAKELLESFHIE